jgi:hypothetical protein
MDSAATKLKLLLQQPLLGLPSGGLFKGQPA